MQEIAVSINLIRFPKLLETTNLCSKLKFKNENPTTQSTRKWTRKTKNLPGIELSTESVKTAHRLHLKFKQNEVIILSSSTV